MQLAQAAGTTQRAVSYYENDTGFPPAAALIDLARALRVSTDELLGVKPPKVERIDSDPETRRLWKRFRQIAGFVRQRDINLEAVIGVLRTAGGHAATGNKLIRG